MVCVKKWDCFSPKYTWCQDALKSGSVQQSLLSVVGGDDDNQGTIQYGFSIGPKGKSIN